MSAYSALVLAHANLQAYFRLGDGSRGTKTEAGPNGLSYTIDANSTGGVTYNVAGAVVNDANTALTFDGSNTGDVLAGADDNALDLGDGPLSIELWVKRSGTIGTVQNLIAKGTGAYEIRFQANNNATFFKQGTAGGVVTAAQAITDSTTWHQIVFTKNGSSRAAYVDGVAVTTLGTNQTLGDTSSNLSIGSNGGTNEYIGSIDEVSIYNAVLSAQDVLDHYRAARGIVTPATTTSAAQALDVDKKVTLTSASETDSAQALTFTKPIHVSITPATETDSAQALTFVKPLRKDITPATETDSAQALTFTKTIYKTLDPAIEQDEAQPLAQQGRTYVSITPATETDEAQPFTYQVVSTSVGGGMPATRKREKPLERIGPPHLVFLQSAYELDNAVPLTYRKEPNLHTEDEELLAILGVV